jgi:hypothetical protein
MGWSNEQYGTFTPSLLALAVGLVLCAFLLAAMKESEMMQADSASASE